MKKHPKIVEAEAAAEKLEKEMLAARQQVERLESEHLSALIAVQKIKEAMDAELPQCRLVRRNKRHFCEVVNLRSVVILRRTPTGRLVVRNVGDTSGHTITFKFLQHEKIYVEASKRGNSSWSQLELRDVPDSFMRSL